MRAKTGLISAKMYSLGFVISKKGPSSAAIIKRIYEEAGCEKMIMTGDRVDIL